VGSEGPVVPVLVGAAHDLQAVGHPAVGRQPGERGQQEPPGEVARGTEPGVGSVLVVGPVGRAAGL
jgi:hypothetical protein